MRTKIKLVQEFHDKFHCHEGQSFKKMAKARCDFMIEELIELREAIAHGDRVKILDALVDIDYFSNGNFIAFGFLKVKNSAFAEVHRSNMTKSFQKTRNGKVVKGKNYSPPDLTPYV